ncbi:hypothetical protein AtEden1_Chr5g0145791 [Arabidopsis thaliana]
MNLRNGHSFIQFLTILKLFFREIKTQEERLLIKKENRIVKFYSRRRSKCMRLT